MNKQEIEKAIESLKNHRYFDEGVIDLAISALTQQLNNGWIPASERLPEDIGWYRTTDISLGKEHPMVCTGWWNGSKFIDFLDEDRECSFDLNFVTAWKGEEEPYKEAL